MDKSLINPKTDKFIQSLLTALQKADKKERDQHKLHAQNRERHGDCVGQLKGCKGEKATYRNIFLAVLGSVVAFFSLKSFKFW